MARDFESSSDQYLYNASAVLNAVPITMACWFKAETASGTGGQTLICVTDFNSNADKFRLQVTNGGNLAAQSRTGSTQSSTHGSSVSTGTWYHGVAVFAGTSSRTAYFDGSASTENTASHTPTAGNISHTLISRNRDTGSQDYAFDGIIADAAIWNVALAAGEISALAAGYSPLFIRPDALKAYWPMGGALSANDSDNDIAGAFNMTSSGSPTTADHPPVIIYPTYPIIFSLAGNAARAMHHYRMLRCS